MKKILIINKSFELGGIQMALSNMLEAICDDYDVSLAVFNPNGPLKSRVPENVKLLKLSPLVEVLGMSGEDCKRFGTFYQKLFKVLSSAWARFFGNDFPVFLALLFQKSVGKYDAVISYHQETSAKTMVTGFGKFALKKCKADKKIAWVHADFLATKLATKQNLKTYKKFHKIVSVSKTTMNNFITAYPELKDKCDYCYNYVSADKIIEKSNAVCDDMTCAENEILLFSACRLVAEKGLVPAIKNILPILKSDKKIKWYIAGEGPQKTDIENIIRENKIEDRIILLGFKENPYPYIKKADYLFLPSLHETFSMVVSEAHILGTRVIASNIPIMHEVLNKTDIMCVDGNYVKAIQNIKKTEKLSYKDEFSKEGWLERFNEVMK